MTNKRKTLLVACGLAALALVGVAATIYAGLYNVAADDPHSRPVYTLLDAARTRSIAARAAKLQVPADLDDPARIRRGAGNYDAMCTGCHLAPGMAPTEMSRGLYPAPPDLTRERVPAAEAFWVIKHGIKASGMPAWGRSMPDDDIWNMAAFLQALPKLDETRYAALVGASEGHSHGGGETSARGRGASVPHGHDDGGMDGHDDGMPAAAPSHPHGPGTPADHHAPKTTGSTGSPADAKQGEETRATHRHADGKVESHPATEPPAEAPHH